MMSVSIFVPHRVESGYTAILMWIYLLLSLQQHAVQQEAPTRLRSPSEDLIVGMEIEKGGTSRVEACRLAS